jgi:hypothetical protein
MMLEDIAAILVFAIITAALFVLFAGGVIYSIWPRAINNTDDFTRKK